MSCIPVFFLELPQISNFFHTYSMINSICLNVSPTWDVTGMNMCIFCMKGMCSKGETGEKVTMLSVSMAHPLPLQHTHLKS